MSRARVHEVSSPISLFPFIGILLCTMGALLVVLVAVSKSARSTAEKQFESKKGSTVQAADDGTHKKLEEVQTYLGNLKSVRGKAENKLRDEQVRLSNVEDHIRRLRARFESLQSAAIELKSLEQEHYDDHKQAEREIERLNKLIDESKKSLAARQEASLKEARSYAVVPYEGANGTFRRPIYIECVNDELIIQPEGVHITADDLRPPLGPGNPLASVLRASRDHLIRLNPKAGESRDLSPYPLLLVRPDGASVSDAALKAIEAGDFDVGYELVESEWKLKFPQADPQLAGIEAQALDEARARHKLLAAAAPRAYGNSSMDSSDDLDDSGDGFGGDDGGPGGGGGSGFGGSGGGRGGNGPRDYIVRNTKRDGGDEYGGGEGPGGNGNGAESGAGTGGTSKIGEGGSVTGTGAPSGVSNGAAGAGGPTSSGGNGGPAGGSAPDKSLVPDGYQGQQGQLVVAGADGSSEAGGSAGASAPRSEKERAMAAENRGKDWALKQKPPRAIPIRRTIRVTVRKDELAILPDSAPATAGGKVIPMRGDTVESVDEFVKQVRDHIEGWGIAGNDLYWRPVVVLSVGPDGGQRASDLARLLKNSGLEVRADETAKNSPKGTAHETR